MAKRIIGIDFGTSTTFVKVKRYENGKPVDGGRLDFKSIIFDSGSGSAALPTAIQTVGEGAQQHRWFGMEAEAMRPGGVIHSNFKVDLESPDAGTRAGARDLTAQLFGFLYQKYQEQRPFLGEKEDEEETIVSYPAKWSEEARRFMEETAKKAGFPNVTSIDEATASIGAVLIQKEEELRRIGVLQGGRSFLFLVADMGAGTTDLAVCRYTPGTPPQNEIVATWPEEENPILFGGREIDSRMTEYFAELLKRDGFPEKITKNLPTQQLDQVKAWKERTLSDTLNRGETVAHCSFLMPFYNMLCFSPSPFSLGQMEFEQLLAAYLKQFPALIAGCLANAAKKHPSFTPSQIALVILTGGHSQWYFVPEMLTGRMTKFGAVDLPGIAADKSRLLTMARPQEIVSLGLVYQPLVQSAKQKPEPKPRPVAPAPEERRVIPPPVEVPKWRCAACGYLHGGQEPPVVCPICRARGVLFEPVKGPNVLPSKSDFPSSIGFHSEEKALVPRKRQNLVNINREGIAAWFQGQVYFIGKKGRVFTMLEEGSAIIPVTPEGDVYRLLYASEKWFLGVKFTRDEISEKELLWGLAPCVFGPVGMIVTAGILSSKKPKFCIVNLGESAPLILHVDSKEIDMLKIADETILYYKTIDKIYGYRMGLEESPTYISKCDTDEAFPIFKGSLYFQQFYWTKANEYYIAKWDETGFSCAKELGTEHYYKNWREHGDSDLIIPKSLERLRLQTCTRIGNWVYFKPSVSKGEEIPPCKRIRIDGTGEEILR